MAIATRTKILPVSGLELTTKKPDGVAEDLLATNLNRMQEVLPDYWMRCIVSLGEYGKPNRKQLLDLTVQDQRVTAVEIGRCAYPKGKMKLGGLCPNCGYPLSVDANLDDMDEDYRDFPEDIERDNPEWLVEVEEIGSVVTLGYITGHDELLLRKKKGFMHTLHRHIKAIDGDTNVRYSTVVAWESDVHRLLRESIQDHDCGYNTMTHFVHDECGKAVNYDLLTDPSFLMPGLPGRTTWAR